MIVSSGMYIEGTGYDRVFRYVYSMIVSSDVYRRYWL